MIEFAVKSKSFENYKEFMHRTEALGWRYYPFFEKFMRSSMINNNCMFYSNKFDDFNRALFSFTNVDNSCMVFNIDHIVGAEQALIFAEKQINKIYEANK
jgi:hypothetical protein